ncbi:hypothetical protein [Salidesulfovibrio brasiliensis]|uniref:hypothetical protein n=1 Tax=Salidesulfovibrio brasiliensis TaxID=221711 RepID=UPI0006D1B831|nr:hypothetical protein [Salidesulfovibrio brasiliensis]
MDWISKALFGAGKGLSVFGDVSDAEEAWKTGVYNREAAYRDADLAKQAGEFDVRQFRRQGREFMAGQSAEVAHSGWARSGSLLDALADNAMQVELEASNREFNAGERARSLRISGDMARSRGASMRKQNYLKAGGTLLSAAQKFWEG